ncbi:MAG: class I SAM-dependent RNA methyltransferase [Deltaproteobacteria bacterium]|nr:class I SAM-dependent RNA methyltransferase [Deltaproteobacteria bacterium]
MFPDPWSEKQKIVLTCPKGIVPWLAGEVRALDFPIHEEGEAAVTTAGTLGDAMRLCLQLRTCHRVLFHLAAFMATDPRGLYAGLHAIPWETLLHASGPHAYLSVTSTADNPTITDGRFVNQKAKDAIVDRLTKRCGLRPDSGPDRNRAVVHVYWKGDRVDVYLDASGEPLSRRGYRKLPLAAPMQESLAAAVILATGWDGRTSFVNPMCGSGTLAIEAALFAQGRAPGLLRSNYGLMHLKGFDPDRWQKARKAAHGMQKETAAPIIATDIDSRAIAAARQNAKTAGVENRIAFAVCPFAQTEVPEPGGVVVLNPPYGERLGEIKKLTDLYGEIGDFFKQRCRGYRGYVFTGNLALGKQIGLRTQRRIPFYNGEIECRLLEYELYAGTRRKEKENGESGAPAPPATNQL